MRLFTEPESWIGLRSERAVAGEFDTPAAGGLRSFGPAGFDRTTPSSLSVVRAAMRRALARVRGR